jgi:hypothetical protein
MLKFIFFILCTSLGKCSLLGNKSPLPFLGHVINAISIQCKLLACPTIIEPSMTTKLFREILGQTINLFIQGFIFHYKRSITRESITHARWIIWATRWVRWTREHKTHHLRYHNQHQCSLDFWLLVPGMCCELLMSFF